MDKKEIRMLPFHAVNEFMRDDYRLTILQEVFNELGKCNPIQRTKISSLFSSGVKLPGFRNSSLAPVLIRVKNSVGLFEKSADFAGIILECWSNLHVELKGIIFEALTQKGWQLHPLQLDRTELPGFGTDWPKEDTFELICKSVNEAQPALKESDDNISLMAVWVGNKLPYNLFLDEEEETEKPEG